MEINRLVHGLRLGDVLSRLSLICSCPFGLVVVTQGIIIIKITQLSSKITADGQIDANQPCLVYSA